VDAWSISEDDGYWKPDTRMLEMAAMRCQANLEDAWLIGDNPDTDIAAAHAANVPSVWIRRERHWPRSDFAPSYEVDTFSDGVDLILSESRP
jgi:putative hydrolase of the HAD superfamily